MIPQKYGERQSFLVPQPILNVPENKGSDGRSDIDDQNQSNRLSSRKFHNELGIDC
mgnify:CR=1 FL=1